MFAPADVTEHIRVDVQTDISHVVNELAGYKPLLLRKRAKRGRFAYTPAEPGSLPGIAQ
jgi:hypothetical protein